MGHLIASLRLFVCVLCVCSQWDDIKLPRCPFETILSVPLSGSRKALDGTVKDIATGAALTSKCADLDSKVLDLMGVSKPILNYVIFCHQGGL